MPGLIVFRRRWSIGSDDFVIPCSIMVVINTIWMMALIGCVIYIHEHDELLTESCPDQFHVYSVASIGVMVVCVACDLALAITSSKGGVMEVEARTPVPRLLYVRLVLLLFKFIWLCVGVGWIAVVSKRGCTTGDFMFRAMCAIVSLNLFTVLITVIGIYMNFDSAGRVFAKLQDLRKRTSMAAGVAYHTPKLKNLYEEKWLHRVSSGFCCVKTGGKPSEQDTFKQVAMIFSSYFDHIDMVLTDFIAGMMLLRDQQMKQFYKTVEQATNDVYTYLSGVPISPRTKFLTLKNADVHAEFQQMTYFMEYALVSYGWQGQCFFYPCQCIKRIDCCCRLPGCCRREETKVTGDNCCQMTYTTIVNNTPMRSKEDLLYANYENVHPAPGFYVCLDHKYKKVLLCVRGTMSLTDTLVDLQGDAADIPYNTSADLNMTGHMGMINAAAEVYKELSGEQVLEKAFLNHQDYKLLIIGHSLGAGVATILSFTLRESYPDLYCYAFAPPGGLLSGDAMEESKRFVTSVVVGKDVVPRLGIAQLEYFRSDILHLLEHTITPKWKILSSRVPVCGKCCVEKQAQGSIPHSRSQVYNPFRSRALSSSHQSLYVPGRIVHILKNYARDGSSDKPLYQPIWSDASFFDQIIVSPSMFTDHMPNSMLDVMREVLVHCGPKKPVKLLSDVERQAMLKTECLSDDCQSHDSGLSWEFACASEASAAGKAPLLDHIARDEFYNRGETPSHWHAATLASFEDLSSIFIGGDSSISSTLRKLRKSTSTNTPTSDQPLLNDTSHNSLRRLDSSKHQIMADKSSLEKPVSQERTTTSGEFIPCVPEGNQQEYNGVSGHYSNSGRGFPHGYYPVSENPDANLTSDNEANETATQEG